MSSKFLTSSRRKPARFRFDFLSEGFFPLDNVLRHVFRLCEFCDPSDRFVNLSCRGGGRRVTTLNRIENVGRFAKKLQFQFLFRVLLILVRRSNQLAERLDLLFDPDLLDFFILNVGFRSGDFVERGAILFARQTAFAELQLLLFAQCLGVLAGFTDAGLGL